MTVQHIYFDTCAFMRYAEGSVAHATERSKSGRAHVQRLLDDADIDLATSETAIIEFHDALGRDTRDGNSPAFDEGWMGQSIEDVMHLIAQGRFRILASPPKAIESALVLMRIAHGEAGVPGVAFNAWDAVHLITACSWAIDLGAKVRLATCDTDFTRFFAHFPYFAPLVEVLMVA